jgi:hypothetical protein
MNFYLFTSPFMALVLAININIVNNVQSPVEVSQPPAVVYEIPSANFYPQIEDHQPEVKTYEKNEQMSPEDLKDLLYSVGFRGERLKQAWAVAMKESTGRPNAHNQNDATGDNSYGLFQINMIGSLGPARRDQFNLESNDELFDPVRNAEIAYFMSNKGKNWSAWHGMTPKTLEWMEKFPKN